jgi:hypothetical protein
MLYTPAAQPGFDTVNDGFPWNHEHSTSWDRKSKSAAWEVRRISIAQSPYCRGKAGGSRRAAQQATAETLRAGRSG